MGDETRWMARVSDDALATLVWVRWWTMRPELSPVHALDVNPTDHAHHALDHVQRLSKQITHLLMTEGQQANHGGPTVTAARGLVGECREFVRKWRHQRIDAAAFNADVEELRHRLDEIVEPLDGSVQRGDSTATG